MKNELQSLKLKIQNWNKNLKTKMMEQMNLKNVL